MNKIDLLKYRNQVASYVRSFHIKRNVVNINAHNSIEHEKIKFEICYRLKSEGQHFFTEAPICGSGNKKGYADIVILDTGTIIEILVSETEEQVKKKVEKYPRMMEIVSVTDSEQYFSGNYKLIREKEI